MRGVGAALASASALAAEVDSALTGELGSGVDAAAACGVLRSSSAPSYRAGEIMLLLSALPLVPRLATSSGCLRLLDAAALGTEPMDAMLL